MGTGQMGEKEPSTWTGNSRGGGEVVQSNDGRNEESGRAQSNSKCRNNKTKQRKGTGKAGTREIKNG